METTTNLNFKSRLQHLITYQDVLAKNYLLSQRSCDLEFHGFLDFHNDLRRKYVELRTHADQMDRTLEEYRSELSRKEKKIQSQSAHILRLTQQNKRNQARLIEFQRCLDGQTDFDRLRDILRDSLISESEATTDLSDKNCTGDELDNENQPVLQNIPKIVSQSNGIGTTKRSNNSESQSVGRIIGRQEKEDAPQSTSPYAGISVGRMHNVSINASRHSLTADKRPKQKVRKPSKEFLSHKSEESELSTDDIFWSKQEPELNKIDSPASNLYPILPKLTSPVDEPKALTPTTPLLNIQTKTTPTTLTFNPSPIRARSHNFLSRNILIPETCCVCLKRINFGKLAYRCQTCAALCHTGCKENCTTLCLPNIKTPNRGAVSKFATRETNQLQIPALLLHCIKEIEQRGLQEVGLYRLNVVESQIKELKERILKSRTGLFDLSHYQDIHLICGVVKDFLRSLSESLLTNGLWKSFATAIDEDSESIKQDRIDSLLHQLPKPNRETLAFLILHLQRVAVSPLCRMPILNLSRTMGPAIIGYSSKHVSGIDIVGETYKQTKILEHFLKLPSEYWSKFLAQTNEPICKSQISTPILVRQQVHLQTPTIPSSSGPTNTFFSPL